MQETQVQSLGKDPLEKEMVTPSSILAWEIPWTEELGGLIAHMAAKESDTTEQLNHNILRHNNMAFQESTSNRFNFTIITMIVILP